MIDSRLNNSHPMRSSYKQLITSLPDLTPSSLDDPYFIVQNGLLQEYPKGWSQMIQSPRYCKGRKHVLIKSAVVSTDISSKEYLVIDSKQKGEQYVTFKT